MRNKDGRQRETEAGLAVGAGGRAAEWEAGVTGVGAGLMLPCVTSENILVRWSWG